MVGKVLVMKTFIGESLQSFLMIFINIYVG